jgi:hypothetical protein
VPLLEINTEPSTRDLRWFAGLWWPLLCGLVGAALTRKLHMPRAAVAVWIAGAAVAIAGLIATRAIKPVYTGLTRLTYPIGYVLSYVLLFLVYFAVFTPIGLLVRLFHDPMSRRFDRPAASYWTAHQPDPQERYFRQF